MVTATQSIPTANIQTGQRQFPPDDYRTVTNVPVFVEHETEAGSEQNRRQLRFSRHELAAVARNCNRRIEQSGDYAAVVIGHTPKEPDKPADMPELVGYAGPFRVGQMPDGKAAILADFHIRHDCVDQANRHPRRSPELWLADDYEEMFFDPISLLGAEAPRLDMGMVFYGRSHVRRREGQFVETYSSVCPGAMNTAIPGDDILKHSLGDSGDSSDSDSNPETGGPSMALAPEDVQEIVNALMQTEQMQWVTQQMEGIPDEPPVDDVPPTDVPPADVPPADTPPVDTPPPDAPPAAPPADTPPAPAADDTPPENIPPSDETDKDKLSRTRYGTDSDDDEDDDPDKDKKEDEPVKYARLQAENAKLARRLKVVEGKVTEADGKRIDAERYSALAELAQARVMDFDKELERCRYGKMSNEQFADHVDLIRDNYQEAPIGVTLPVPERGLSAAGNRPGAAAQKEKYSKECSDKARRICEERVMRGEKADYAAVLAEVAGE